MKLSPPLEKQVGASVLVIDDPVSAPPPPVGQVEKAWQGAKAQLKKSGATVATKTVAPPVSIE